MRPKIYIFIPVFNEQETVGILLYRISELMKALRFEYQVILTLDGCTDESPEVVAQYLAGIPLRVIDHDRRQGYGPSLLEALRIVLRESESPKRDFFLVLDGDFPVDLGCLEEMAQHIDRNVDLYTADSFTEARRQTRQRRVAQWLVRRVLRLKHCEPSQGVADLLTTFRGCRVHLLSRTERELDRLGRLGRSAPQAASLLFFLTLLPFSRKFMEIRVKQRRITRRKSRFAPLGLARFLFFTNLFPALPGTSTPVAESRPAVAPDIRSEKAVTAQSSALPEERVEGRSSRRRRRRKSAAERREQPTEPVEQKSGEKKQPQPQKPAKLTHEPSDRDQKDVPDRDQPDAGENKPKSRRRRRRRRPANKDGQGTSNSGESTD